MSRTMWGIVKAKREPGAELREVPVPAAGPDDVLVRVVTSSICGTDMHIYQWDRWADENVHCPNVFGHEFAGIVEAVGERVHHIKIGDRVSGEGHIVCGRCRACRTGNAHVCPHTRSFGITAPGCFAAYAVIPAANVIPNLDSVPWEIACLQDPLGNAVQTVLSGEIAGRSVAVVGAGPIGLMAIAVARACGAGTVIAADINPYRLRLAETMGADAVFNVADGGMASYVRSRTGGEGAEVVLEMSGHPAAIRESFDAAANAARVSLLGIPSQDVTLDLAKQLIFKGIRVEGITGRRMYRTWYELKGMLEAGRLDLRPLITHSFTPDRYEEAFELMASGQCGKIIFRHQEQEGYGDAAH